MTQLNTSNAPANLERRRTIQLLGGGVVFAATTLSGCSTAFPEESVEAWQAPATNKHEGDIRLYLLAHALLAPNPHNRQPWLADISKPNQISLICDATRLLPQTDPFGRQILIGCGAFIELAVIAAAERGYSVKVDAFPLGEPPTNALLPRTVIATLSLEANANQAKDPLFEAIRRRRTNKYTYDNARSLPAVFFEQQNAIARNFDLLSGAATSPEQLTQIRGITRTSFITEITTERTWLESAHLLRIGSSEVQKHRDGIPVMGYMPRLLDSLGLFDRFALPQEGNTAFKTAMKIWAPQETGSAYVWLASADNSRKSQLTVGRAFVRTQLTATAQGVDMHPISQALQEFAEVKKQYDAMYTTLNLNPQTATLQMLSRVGYAEKTAEPKPRRPLTQMII